MEKRQTRLMFFPYFSLQLILVLSSDWNAVDGTLYCYERASVSEPWERVFPDIDITLGRCGMAWGHNEEKNPPQKQEGDGRSPAGVFALGPVFGQAENQEYAKNMPFLVITEDLECIDDPGSTYYNQFVHTHSIEHKDWKSSENMQQVGPLYALGLVVQHNMSPAIAGLGSAIFMHIWKKKGEGSAGCTVMSEEHMKKIASWLNAKKHPHLVQLPIAEYEKKQSLWDLPQQSFLGNDLL
jgi:L,D-peptidoglycan transpeptidase YkuD (ErfK/YbiS/YcfS/YnhG family)